ncbi:MAG: hypothetical protein R3C29_00790 [Dehalococcoidia bacterium]|nr:hypothetical protein [Dehalococcoidia bacterium]
MDHVEFTNRIWAARDSIEAALGLVAVEADEEHVTVEVGRNALTWAPETGAYEGIAVEAAMAIVEQNYSVFDAADTEVRYVRYVQSSRVTRFLRRAVAEQLLVTARTKFRGRARWIIESVAHDGIGREFIIAQSEFAALPDPIEFRLP